MKKRWAVAAAATAVVMVGVGSPAGAIPEHKAETWICEGEEVTLVGTGRSGWIDGVHYLAVYLEFIGVFTPEGAASRNSKASRSSTATAAISCIPTRSAATCISRDDPRRGNVRG